MIVLDSCAAIEALRKTPEGNAIRQALQYEDKVISCDLLRAEVASVLRKFVRQGTVTPEEANRNLAEAMDLVDEFYPLKDLQAEALAESIRLDHSVYDMFYFVLARRTRGMIFTVDHAFLKLCEQHGLDCMTIIDF